VQLYTTIACEQNQEGYKTPILCDFGYWNRNEKGKIEKAKMKFMKFCWLYAVRDAISDFTVRCELQKGKGELDVRERGGAIAYYDGDVLNGTGGQTGCGLELGREDGRPVYEDSHTIGRDPTGRP
jgi:hypothetical protein